MNQRDKAMMESARVRLEKARAAYEAVQHSDDPEVVRRELPVAEHELKSAQRDWARYEAPAQSVVPVKQWAPSPALIEQSVKASKMQSVLAIVDATAKQIQNRRYIQVEGWQAIALAHGCVASAGEVERVEDKGCAGFRAIGKVITADTGTVLATAEGFVGDDEQMWRKRPVFARRAMAQTRAISRACRSAFAHVVVLINSEHNKSYGTTPAEEMMPDEVADNAVEGEVESESKWAAEIDEMCKLYGADPAKVWDWLGQQSHDRYSVTEKTANAVGDRLRRKAAKEKEAAA